MKLYMSVILSFAATFGLAQFEYFHAAPYTDRADPDFVDSNADGTDGSMNGPIFVAPWGDDAWPGSTLYPLKTINAGIITAEVLGRPEVYIMSTANYNAERIILPQGISLVGGFDTAWIRRTNLLSVIAPYSGAGSVAIFANGISPDMTLLNLDVYAPTGYLATSDSSVALWVNVAEGTASNSAVINSCRFTAADGGSGGVGLTGATGKNGFAGTSSNSGVIGATGGSGGASDNGGGRGGLGNLPTSALSGENGKIDGQPNGGFGGLPGDSGNFDAGNGGAGNPGFQGGPGGTGSYELFSFANQGGIGKNGAGGGGGGGSSCGGAGGGGGGTGGYGGGAGWMGGNSIGVLVYHYCGGRPFVMSNCNVYGANAGRGGTGAIGAAGGAGGAKGIGRIGPNGGRSGDGGKGGAGGPGGGGGGGNGGWSYAIVSASQIAPSVTTTLLAFGSAGLGGAGGVGGPGASGSATGATGLAGQNGLMLVNGGYPNAPLYRKGNPVVATHLVGETLRNTATLFSPVVRTDLGWAIVGVSAPNHGTANIYQGTTQDYVYYSPAANYVGYDTFTYQVSAGSTPVTGTACIYVAQPMQIHVDFEDWTGPKNYADLQLLFYGYQDKLERVQTFDLDANGNATIPGPGSFFTSNFKVRLKFGHWLSQDRSYYGGNPTLVSYSLHNGDVDCDDVVSLFDYLPLSKYFDRSRDEADWNLEDSDGNSPNKTDLDGDGVISLFDYLILSANFDQQGPIG